MENKTYKITLADGQELDGLTMNGNNFVSQTPVDATMFENNLAPVTISDGQQEEVHEHMEFLGETVVDGGHGFVLLDIPPEKLETMQLRADLEYLAAQSGVELEGRGA